jgi:hypothetical protein
LSNIVASIDFANNPRRHPVGHAAIRNVANHDRAGPDDAVGADLDPVDDARADADECTGAHDNPPAQCYPRGELDRISDLAIVVNARARVDDGVAADPGAWLYDGAGKDDGSESYAHVGRNDGGRMDRGAEPGKDDLRQSGSCFFVPYGYDDTSYIRQTIARKHRKSEMMMPGFVVVYECDDLVQALRPYRLANDAGVSAAAPERDLHSTTIQMATAARDSATAITISKSIKSSGSRVMPPPVR